MKVLNWEGACVGASSFAVMGFACGGVVKNIHSAPAPAMFIAGIILTIEGLAAYAVRRSKKPRAMLATNGGKLGLAGLAFGIASMIIGATSNHVWPAWAYPPAFTAELGVGFLLAGYMLVPSIQWRRNTIA